LFDYLRGEFTVVYHPSTYMQPSVHPSAKKHAPTKLSPPSTPPLSYEDKARIEVDIKTNEARAHGVGEEGTYMNTSCDRQKTEIQEYDYRGRGKYREALGQKEERARAETQTKCFCPPRCLNKMNHTFAQHLI
jgi:hypothetical protein